MRTKEGNKERDILSAAIKVFAQQGYHGAKISKIAEVAGVATGSVYLYFRNKSDILRTIFDNIWQQLANGFENIILQEDLDPINKLDGMIDLYFTVFMSDPAFALVFVNEQNHLLRDEQADFTINYEQFLDYAERVLVEGIQAGVFYPNLDLRVIRIFVLGGLRQLIQQWANDPDSFSVENMHQFVKFLIKKGLLI